MIIRDLDTKLDAVLRRKDAVIAETVMGYFWWEESGPRRGSDETFALLFPPEFRDLVNTDDAPTYTTGWGPYQYVPTFISQPTPETDYALYEHVREKVSTHYQWYFANELSAMLEQRKAQQEQEGEQDQEQQKRQEGQEQAGRGPVPMALLYRVGDWASAAYSLALHIQADRLALFK